MPICCGETCMSAQFSEKTASRTRETFGSTSSLRALQTVRRGSADSNSTTPIRNHFIVDLCERLKNQVPCVWPCRSQRLRFELLSSRPCRDWRQQKTGFKTDRKSTRL